MEYIHDEKLNEVQVRENGEKLVDIANYNKSIITVEKCMVREAAAKLLDKAQKELPHGVRLKIFSACRPMETEKEAYYNERMKILKSNPEMSKAEVEEQAKKWVGDPSSMMPPHTTGGAIDLTLVGEDGNEMNMGTPLGTDSDNAPTDDMTMPAEARKNRLMLKRVMESSEFVNHPLQWWHWSYGDRYWAASKKAVAMYGSVD